MHCSTVADVSSLLFSFYGSNGDAGDERLVSVQVGVAVGERAHGEEVAVAEAVAEGVQAPAGEGHVRGGESEGHFLRRLVLVAFGIRVRFERVVNQLAGEESMPVLITEGELDAGTGLVSGEDAIAFFENIEAHNV